MLGSWQTVRMLYFDSRWRGMATTIVKLPPNFQASHCSFQWVMIVRGCTHRHLILICSRLMLYYFWLPLVLPYFSQLGWRSSLRVICVGGLWKVHDLRQLADLRTQHLVLGFCFFIRGSSLSNCKFEYYTILLGVSTALCLITRNLQSCIWYYDFHLIITEVL
jgi:hypothetical protein